VDPDDTTKWIFNLREGVTFHDGSPFNAEAVVWNVQKVMDEERAAFRRQPGRRHEVAHADARSARAIDDLTVELTTSEPDSFLPMNLTNLFMASPAHWQAKFDAVDAASPTRRARRLDRLRRRSPRAPGPSTASPASPRASGFEMVRQPDYWDPSAHAHDRPRGALPLPEANARTAALLSGQVDWIEAPSPDAIPQIESRGLRHLLEPQPHVWPWQFSFVEGSPWLDKRVRHAANLCINREELQAFSAATWASRRARSAPGHPWWGNPSFDIRTTPTPRAR
jgi:peptide/nickel transport system substrate-binding protein